jgi:hypothetical protein
MSASRRKGKWVGGIPPLGYDVAANGGKLIVNQEEAQQVRAIFALYLEHGDLIPVLDEMQKRQWTTKKWTTKSGRFHPGRPLGRPDLIRVLTNRLYTGRVQYQGQSYPGEHAAIVEERVWQRVQRQLEKDGEPRDRMRQQPELQSDLQQPGGEQGVKRETESCDMRGESMPCRTPRITRLLALALKFEGLIQQGVVKDYSELARLGKVSRARVTQIMNLLNLAPDIQEEILSWAGHRNGQPHLRESSLRILSAEVVWTRQRDQWKNWTGRPGNPDKD